MEKIHDMIIIGGGPAGYTAALYACRAGLDVLLLERMSPGGQMTLTGTIDNYPGFSDGVDGFSLAMKMQEGAEKFGAKTEYADVLSAKLDGDVKILETTSGKYLAKTVVISTGANPRELGIDGEEEYTGKGVHYCAHCDGRFYKDKTVVVAGGGNTAVDDALYLSNIAEKVYLVHRRDQLRAEKIYVDALMKAQNVEFCWNSTVSAIEADDRVNAVKIADTKTSEIREIKCDAIFVSIGRKPATEFLKGIVGLDDGGYIIAGEDTKTNVPGVFAAGDVRTKALRQIVTAVADGAAAVQSANEYLASKA